MTAALKHLLAVAVLALALVPALCGADVACVLHGDTPFPGAVMGQARAAAPSIRLDVEASSPAAPASGAAAPNEQLSGPAPATLRLPVDALMVSLRV